ncbi:MAG: hydantoinase [candidate division KSB1 bacterium]|nr:hydantoinase [candidate division KSB1 bacterium]MDZ7276336.1 hydantoinase [candidate division KSB1 bacterium]MDZ7287711.1 hydantoinase [candidate division KSB1 bacterium]MDZ7299949.1 hydantoinase [candidate division KSB1 bacterium]MDZ7305722.1 hydantoinase [candidate division KSB1 bacterium]
MRRIRIGIDVGGTFINAVALDTASFSIIAHTKTPTTHHANSGVAHGMVTVLRRLLRKGEIDPAEIILVAYSTTLASNALLEGDVAKVGIIGMGTGLKTRRVRRETNIKDLELAPGKKLPTCYRFLDTRRNFSTAVIRQTLHELQAEGAQAIVAAEAFSVENPRYELQVLDCARELGLPATATQQISQLYGLRLRTRTAVLTASILPVMLATLEMMERSLEEAGIQAPLMIMRSDGGVMDVKSMRERPLLTLLSGPAAGIAGALMYASLTEGIFLEVGGTSTNISLIHRGQVAVHTARLGPHQLSIKAFDIHSVAVAGGSMIRIQQGRVHDVGPRSAHLARMPYEAFSETSDIHEAEPTLAPPRSGDPGDYVFLQHQEKKIALTLTGAANLLGCVPDYDYARGGQKNVGMSYAKLGRLLDQAPEQIAEAVMQAGCRKIAEAVRSLLSHYELPRENLRLVGAGGAAATVVPYTARLLNLPFTVVLNSALFSAIGVALAMIRETIERSLVNPTEEDLINLRQEAERVVLARGASAESVDIKIEVDAQHHLVRAIATGATDARLLERIRRPVPAHQRASVAADALDAELASVQMLAHTDFFTVYSAVKTVPRFFGLLKSRRQPMVIVDQHGVVRLTFEHAEIREMTAGEGRQRLQEFLEKCTHYGDSGAWLPGIYLAIGPRLVDFSGLVSINQILSLGTHELEQTRADSPVLLVADLKN